MKIQKFEDIIAWQKGICSVLYISLGSTSEMKSMLYLAKRLSYLDNPNAEVLSAQSVEISKIITGLIKSLHPTSTNN